LCANQHRVIVAIITIATNANVAGAKTAKWSLTTSGNDGKREISHRFLPFFTFGRAVWLR
jgi:hypothetical protein